MCNCSSVIQLFKRRDYEDVELYKLIRLLFMSRFVMLKENGHLLKSTWKIIYYMGENLWRKRLASPFFLNVGFFISNPMVTPTLVFDYSFLDRPMWQNAASHKKAFIRKNYHNRCI